MKGNFVAKNMNKFNKAAIHTDRKQAAKDGYEKHKGKDDGDDYGSQISIADDAQGSADSNAALRPNS